MRCQYFPSGNQVVESQFVVKLKQLIHYRECLIGNPLGAEERMDLLLVLLRLLTGVSPDELNECQKSTCQFNKQFIGEKEERMKKKKKTSKQEPFMSKFLNEPFVNYSSESLEIKYNAAKKRKRKFKENQ